VPINVPVLSVLQKLKNLISIDICEEWHMEKRPLLKQHEFSYVIHTSNQALCLHTLLYSGFLPKPHYPKFCPQLRTLYKIPTSNVWKLKCTLIDFAIISTLRTWFAGYYTRNWHKQDSQYRLRYLSVPVTDCSTGCHASIMLPRRYLSTLHTCKYQMNFHCYEKSVCRKE
jgi:hypothetical protein